jgi:hypothetical protein
MITGCVASNSIQVYVPQNIHKIYVLNKIWGTNIWLEFFLYYCILSTGAFSSWHVKILYDKKTNFWMLFKCDLLYQYLPQNIHGHFHQYFENGYYLLPKIFPLIIHLICHIDRTKTANVYSRFAFIVLQSYHYMYLKTCIRKLDVGKVR